MVHQIETIINTVDQLNIMNNEINKSGVKVHSIMAPDFVKMVVARMIYMYADKEDTDNIEIVRTVAPGTTDPEYPVYIATVEGINKAFVDNAVVDILNNDYAGYGLATIIVVPTDMFENDDISVVMGYLKDIYFGIVNNDPFMRYSASTKMLSSNIMYNKEPVIPMYDIEMNLAAIVAMSINMRSWFSDGNSTIDSSYVFKAFKDDEIDEDTKKDMIKAISKINNTSSFRESIASGTILKMFMT